MATLIIDRIETHEDIVNLARQLLDCLANDDVAALLAPGTLHLWNPQSTPSAAELSEIYGLEATYECTFPHHRTGCTCQFDAAHLDPRQLTLVEVNAVAGPVSYVPCPARGTHTKTTDCWLCWCDVARGVITEAQALAPHSPAALSPSSS